MASHRPGIWIRRILYVLQSMGPLQSQPDGDFARDGLPQLERNNASHHLVLFRQI